MRFLCVRDKCRFGHSIPNLIDLLAVLPFYVTLAVESLHRGTTELENMGRVVQVLRLLRSLRMLKLGRHSTGEKTMVVRRFGFCFRCFKRTRSLQVLCVLKSYMSRVRP